jgi:hypothetical protein
VTNVYTYCIKKKEERIHMDNFFSAEDLALLNEELEEMEHSAVEKEPEDTEMNASARRYQEIIKKHKGDC